jgi:hypothetical protein
MAAKDSKRAKQKYTKQQRNIAMRLLEEECNTSATQPSYIRVLSRELGTAPSTLRRWVEGQERRGLYVRNLNFEVSQYALDLLPKWALVAFAARTARRALPFIEAFSRRSVVPVSDTEGTLSTPESIAAETLLKAVDAVAAGKIACDELPGKFKKELDVLREALWATDRGAERAAYDSALQAIFDAFDCAYTYNSQYGALAATRVRVAVLHSLGHRVTEVGFAQWRDFRALLVRAFKGQLSDTVQVAPDLFGDSQTQPSYPRVEVPIQTAPIALSSDQIAGLPDHAMLAVASREAIRIVGALPRQFQKETLQHLKDLQDVSALGHGDPLLPLSTEIAQLADRIDHDVNKGKLGISTAAIQCIFSLGRCVRCVWADSYDLADSHFQSALVFANRAASEGGVLVAADILGDVSAAGAYSETLPRGRNELGAGPKRQRRPFPQSLFAEYVAFDLDQPIKGSTLLEMHYFVTDELITKLAAHPDSLYQLEPRAFEELIARVFEIYGFTVEVTSRTRDSGRDVIAISHDAARVKYLIECKKYARTNKVGISLVQRLHGVLHGDRGTRAILATTSTFTRPAREYMSREHVKLEFEGKDFNGVHNWLVLADRLAVAKRALRSRFIIDSHGTIVKSDTK